MTFARQAWAPGRVNLMGDHTDYNGGLVMPIAIDLGTEVTFSVTRPATAIHLTSESDPDPVDVEIEELRGDKISIGAIEPRWGRLAAAVARIVGMREGGDGTVRTTLPVGAGLSSSASLEVALALAFGYEGDRTGLARAAHWAETAATGVRTGIMDQLTAAAGAPDHALLIDCTTESVGRVRMPAGVEVVVVHSGEPRTLATSPYMERRSECQAAAAQIGLLVEADPGSVDLIDDPLLVRRARHVVCENARVKSFAAALRHQDLAAAGRIMAESHASLRDDFDVSTPSLDALVSELSSLPGVFGARLTGAGFGGCAVALAKPGSVDLDRWPGRAWIVRPSGGAVVRMVDV